MNQPSTQLVSDRPVGFTALRAPRSPRAGRWTLRLALVATAATAALVGCRSSSGEASDEQLFEMYRETAFYQYELGDIDRAEAQAIKALEIERDDTALRLMVGWIQLHRGTPKELTVAEGIFRELADDEDDYRAELGLAEALERLGQGYDEALRNALDKERSVDVDVDAEVASDTPTATESVAGVDRTPHLRARRDELWKEALERFASVLAERPSNLKAANGMMRLYLLLGDLESSLGSAELVLEITGAELEAWERQLERPSLSEREEARLRNNRESSADLELETRLTAAFLLRRLGRKEDALVHLDRAVELAPDTSAIFSRRAQVLGELSDFERAIADIDRYLRLSEDPYDHPDVRRAFELKVEWEARREAARASAGS